MRLLRAGARTRSWLTVGTVAVGLLAGGTWFASTQWAGGGSLLNDLTRRALAQEVPPPPQPPAVPKPTGGAAANSKRPTGEVTEITAAPASLTLRTATGALATYRVLDTTVFMAGRDRPYRFDLVKIGDTVVVRGGGQGKSQAAGGAGAPNGKGKPKPGRGAAVVVTGDGELIARQVMVRPAGEARGGKKGRPLACRTGGAMALESERTRVAHLLRRAGFGPSEQELNEYARLGFDGAVTRLLDYDSQPEVPDRAAPEEVGIQTWWLDKMVHTRRPLQEKMTLFWHGHLTSALRKVKDPNLLFAQNQLFRANALGSFGDMLKAISRDGAMIRWLDLQTNRVGAPNENYARELLELFTLGVGNYTEDDVDEVARAFTGWSSTPDGQFLFRRMQHDFGSKTILGQTGTFDGDAVSEMLAGHPTTARFVSAKLFRFFAYPSPGPEVIDRLAGVYLANNGSIRSVVEAILRSPEFSSERAYRGLIKSPTELIVGALRALGADSVPPQAVGAMRLLGQELFDPPNVAGWFGNRSWINAATLLGRFNVLGALTNQLGGPAVGGPQITALLDGTSDSAGRVQRVLDLLIDGEATSEERVALVGFAEQARGPQQMRGLFRLAMALPAYQLN